MATGATGAGAPNTGANAPTPTTQTTATQTGATQSMSGAPTALIVGFVVIMIGLVVFLLTNNKKGKQGGSADVNKETKTEQTETWATHSLSKPGDSVRLDIPFGWHLHTFSLHNKMYGLHPQGLARQVIGGGVKYTPHPSNARYAYIYFEKEADEIDCMIVKSGKCPYDDY